MAIEPERTLVFLDEIQEVPRAVQALKYFAEDAPSYAVVAAGSLPGIHEHAGTSFPVGKIDSLFLYPLSFFEFLNAVAGPEWYQLVRDSSLEELSAFHGKLTEYLRQYYFTGGMPEVVQAFAGGASPQEVRRLQTQILSDYANDVCKHAPADQVPRIDQVWNSIPAQLAREHRKFTYANIRKGARAKEFELAIRWLRDAGLVYQVDRVTKGAIPLKFHEDFSAFKLFFLDCGLMGAKAEAPASRILIGDNGFTEYKGAFTEQYVLQQLRAMIDTTLYYFSSEDSSLELDFLYQKGENLVPVEVKAEENLRAKSLRQFCLDHEGVKGVRISMSPYREQEWMVNIPLYAVGKL